MRCISRWRVAPIARGLCTRRRGYTFAAATFSVGRVERQVESGEMITTSSRERTVVDLMRLRSRVGRDVALSALRRYLQGRDAKPGELLALARQLRVGTVMAESMEPLLA